MVNFYGIWFALSFLILFFLVRVFLKHRQKDPGLSYTAMLYIIAGVVIGARLLYVLYYAPGFYLNEPLEVFSVWKGGLGFHGGLVGALLASYVFCRRNDIDFLEIADFVAIPAALFLGIGRIANFVNGELYGSVTDVAWCVNFEGVEGCRHPTQIYSAIKNLLIFAVLIPIKKRNVRKGVIFFTFLALYSFFRFFIDMFREYNTVYFGIGAGQYLNLLTFLVAGFFLWRITKKNSQSLYTSSP